MNRAHNVYRRMALAVGLAGAVWKLPATARQAALAANQTATASPDADPGDAHASPVW